MDDNRFDKIEQKLDMVIEKISAQSVLLERHGMLHEKNTLDLADHIKRTNLLEAQLDTALEPITFFKTLGKILAFIAVIIGIYSVFK